MHMITVKAPCYKSYLYEPLTLCLSPVLQEPTLLTHLRRLMVGAHRARAAHAPKNQKPKLFTSAAHKSSAMATTLQSLEARAHSSSNLPKEPTREVEEITGAAEVANPLNATATTRLCRPCCTVAAQQDMGVRMCTTCHTKPNLPAITSTRCNTATANA